MTRRDGVGGEFGDGECGTFREVLRGAPEAQLRQGEKPGEPGATASGWQQPGDGVRFGVRAEGGVVHGSSVAAGNRCRECPAPYAESAYGDGE